MKPIKVNTTSIFPEINTGSAISSIGSYSLGKTIGEGSFGKVKLAVHTLTNVKVAIKIIDKLYAPAIVREVETWRHLNHENIAKLYQVLTSETKIFLVTELCNGGDLLDHIIKYQKSNKSIPLHLDAEHIKFSKTCFYDLLLAVQYCHSKNFVHRDLKLENILLTSEKKIKVIDFGFTRKFENSLLNTHCGSVGYAAPEIIGGERYSGPEADIWSLGVVLFTLAIGYLPFDDENEQTTHKKIKSSDFSIPQTVSPELTQLLKSILSINPKSRPTIPQILAHPWLTTHDHQTATPPPPINHTLIASLTAIGVNTTSMVAAVENNLCDELCAFYHMLQHSEQAREPSEGVSPVFGRPMSPFLGARLDKGKNVRRLSNLNPGGKGICFDGSDKDALEVGFKGFLKSPKDSCIKVLEEEDEKEDEGWEFNQSDLK